MDFILQHDWLHRGSEKRDFLTEEAIQRSNLNRIISGTFRDPLISDEDSDEDRKHNIDVLLEQKQDKVNKNSKQSPRSFIAGFRPLPLFPRQSSLTVLQHARGVRLLAEADSTITTYHGDFRATKVDRDVFKEIEEEYKKEEKEFRNWAQREWLEKRCIRALRPMPVLERMYEGDRSVRVAMMSSLPAHYEYAAQIKMSSEREETCRLDFIEDLKKVDMSELPLVTVPAMDRLQSIAFPLPEQFIPKPCRQHPCRVVLPDENRTSSLPLRELHTELAKYAASQKAKCIISEKALRNLVHTNTEWCLPVSVENVHTAEGLSTVVVVDSEVHPTRELTRVRTAKALNLLLRHHLTRNNKMQSKTNQDNDEKIEEVKATQNNESKVSDSDNSDDEEQLCIDMIDDEDEKAGGGEKSCSSVREQTTADVEAGSNRSSKPSGEQNKQLLLEGSHLLGAQCTCRGTPFEIPPHISYKKWSLKSKDCDAIPIIVYTSHKTKSVTGSEIILNAIPEYQIELSASTVAAEKLRSLALALTLRENSQLLSARIDATTGHIVTLQYTEQSELMSELADEPHSGRKLTEEAVNMIQETISQLCRLKPNTYVLKHEPQHGENALLFVSCSPGAAALHTLSLQADDSYQEDKERTDLQSAPTLSRALLPVHKLRKLLPLAFSPYPPHRKLRPSNRDKKLAAAAELKKKKNARKREKIKLKKKQKNVKQK